RGRYTRLTTLCLYAPVFLYLFFFQAEDGIRDSSVTGVQTCALPISVGLPALPALPAHATPPASPTRVTILYDAFGGRAGLTQDRSEERRVGKECRSRWSGAD